MAEEQANSNTSISKSAPVKRHRELDVNRISYSAMKGFGVGVVLAVLTTVATGSPATVPAIMQNGFTIVFTLLGMGLGFEI